MDKIDKSIKSYLAKSLNRQASAACPADDVLADYVSGGLATNEAETLEKHTSGCKLCLEKISLAMKADSAFKQGSLSGASEAARAKAKQIGRRQKRKSSKNLWLAATIITFGLSFVFPRYFMQFLAASILLGMKWIAESENMRTMILVLDSWRRHQHDRDEEISQRLSQRNNTRKSLRDNL